MKMMCVSVIECRCDGLVVCSGASVKATQCEFSENGEYGVSVFGGSKAFFNDCTFHHNGLDGVVADDEGTLVKLRGEQTEIHHNRRCGIAAYTNSTINICIPSQPITTLVHENGEARDLHTSDGSKILSQLSSSSLELTVIQEAPPDIDEEDDEEDY